MSLPLSECRPTAANRRNVVQVYVIELWDGGKYIPTVGVGRTRESGELELSRWRKRLPKDTLRLQKYVRSDK